MVGNRLFIGFLGSPDLMYPQRGISRSVIRLVNNEDSCNLWICDSMVVFFFTVFSKFRMSQELIFHPLVVLVSLEILNIRIF